KGILYREGFPKLPVIRFYANVKNDSDIQVLPSTDRDDYKMRSLSLDIEPSIPSVPKIAGAKSFLTIDRKTYDFDSYPQYLYKVEDAGTVRGIPQKLVTIYPLQYEGKTKSLNLVSKFQVTVSNIK